jgi:hypothetical protein
MASLRHRYKYLLFIVPALFVWMQYLVVAHDQSHHNITDDCVICKIAETSNAKANEVDVSFTYYFHTEPLSIFILKIVFKTILWETPLTRAPPAS